MDEVANGNEGTTSTSSTSTSSSEAPSSALASLEKVAASSTAESGDAAARSQAVNQPGTAGATGPVIQPGQVVDKQYHEPPQEKWPTILENARKTEREAILKQFGWAQGLNQQQATRAIQIAAALDADPRAFIRWVGQQIGEGQPAKAVLDDADPEPDLQSQDGKLKSYSDVAVRRLLDRQAKQLREEILKEVQPAIEYTKTAQADREFQEIKTQATEKAGSAVEAARKLPHFKENEAAIDAELGEMVNSNPQMVADVGAVAALYMAYNNVLATKVFPTLKDSAAAEVRENFERSATASAGSVRPGVGAPKAKPKLKDGDVTGLARHMQRLAAEQ